MIYSDQLKFVFIHNPKAAGTSVRRTLEAVDDSQGVYWRPHYLEEHTQIVDRAHIQATELEQHGLWDKVQRYFVFGFVRNPYERFFSAWEEHKIQHDLPDSLDINDWAQQHLTHASIRFDWRYIHFCPQHYFFYRGKKCIADYIGRMETIDSDWLSIQKSVGQAFPLGVHNEKKSAQNRASLEHLTDATLALVNDLYDRDFTLFGYEKLLTRTASLHAQESPYLRWANDSFIPERRAISQLIELQSTERCRDLEQQLNHLKEESEVRRIALEDRDARIQQWHEQQERIEHELRETRDRLSELGNRLTDTESSLTHSRTELNAILNSRSFRYTALLRKAAQGIRKTLRGA